MHWSPRRARTPVARREFRLPKPMVAATVVLPFAVLLALTSAGCEENAPDGQPAGTGALATAAGHGGAPPEYPIPVPLVTGKYKPPSAAAEARTRWEAALNAANLLDQFNGTVNGIRLYGRRDAATDPAIERKECVATQFPEVTIFRYSHLPPGTSAVGPQYGGLCADGSTAWTVQDFVYGYGRFTIAYEIGEASIAHEAGPDRVAEAIVAGRPGVVVRPLIEEGNGESIVAYRLDKGIIVVSAQNLPLAETVKIAEGVTCVDC